MSALDLLREFVLLGWSFHRDGEQLRYRAPRRALGENDLARLKTHKAEILELLRSTPECVELAPLSYNQRALWFLWVLAPESTAYNQSYSMHTSKRTSGAVWREVCTRLVARHPMLRTRFSLLREGPVQQVHRIEDIAWQTTDLSRSASADQERLIAAAHRVSFDLENDFPVRFHVFYLPEGRLQLLITMHHIVCDGWSMEIIRRELEAMYDACVAGREVQLPTLETSYRDYVWWQRDLLDGPRGEALWQYWKEWLAGPLPVMQLPTDRPRPAVQTYEGDAIDFQIPQELAEGLRKLSREAGATLYSTLLTAYLVLLFRWTRQRDLLIGTPTAGRTRMEDTNVIGYFVDPIVIRARLEEGETLGSLLKQVRLTVLEALSHRDFPFALLVERLRIERDPSRSPIFDTTFNFLSRREAEEDHPKEAPKLRQADGKFDLALTVLENGDQLHASLGYNSALFDASTVDRLSQCWLAVLKGMVTNPDTACDRVALRSSDEPRLIPALMGRPWREVKLAHELFEQQARATPDSPAIKANGATLSYRDVNGRANCLARRLVALGVKRDSQVAVCTGRSPEFLVAILAVWKAGGSYIPIDPTYPRELRDYFLHQARACVLLMQEDLASSWQGSDLPQLLIEKELKAVEENLHLPADPNQLAYVIYTSGSTGKPKGVAVEHRSLSNYIDGMIEDLEIEPHSQFAFLSTIGADLGNTAIFLSVGTGGCLHMLPEHLLIDSSGFRAYMTDHSIDYLKIVPSHFAALTAQGDVSAAMPNRGLILGGEGASPRWVRELQEHRPGCRIFNHYGPTETTIGVLSYRFSGEEGNPGTRFLPLRKAVPGCNIYLLDENGESVSQGFVGEVAIGGRCVARGYIHAPALTEERFVSYPEAGVLYRTGDMARQLGTGDLELLGRQDQQVSLRGFRVELGHVETVLRREGNLQQCVVLPISHRGEITHLAAYAVCGRRAEDIWPTPSSLREIAKRMLPPYMVPERYIILDRMPVTANGKIDRARLLEAPGIEEAAKGYASARDHVEFRLVEMMTAVLGASNIGVRDDFFQLGGHSLLCVQLAGMIFDEFQVRLPLPAFFRYRTVEQLASCVRAGATAARSCLVPIRQSGTEEPLFLFPGAGGSTVYFYPLVQSLEAERPVWGIQYLAPKEDGQLPKSVEEMAAYAVDAIRREIGTQGPFHLAGHSLGGLVAFEAARQLQALGCETVFLGVMDNAAPASTPVDCDHWDESRWLRHIGIRLEKLYDATLGVSDELTVDTLLERMLSAGLLPPGTNNSYLRGFIDVYCANAIAAARYCPTGSPLPVRITLFRASEEDGEVGVQGAPSVENSLGWRKYTDCGVEVLSVPGTHITMLTEPNVRELAHSLQGCLAKTLQVPVASGNMRDLD
ncbi:non-ribosomal peptide synthetase [Edaphobacter sp. 12200R-103]|uniref:non-ribosomal peptide synthetase n=1 Tax=Edaphobacter sp. 12200R-103 TaxID=2703788 RepID=UPI00138CABB3|nr:non-ribosomal peptide synthetase [Edaphobacter sp. 12200R-103]QHS52949.1 amino acid adenylation domain-containing protein [Edaphobacter sp. 12200R-103]